MISQNQYYAVVLSFENLILWGTVSQRNKYMQDCDTENLTFSKNVSQRFQSGKKHDTEKTYIFKICITILQKSVGLVTR